MPFYDHILINPSDPMNGIAKMKLIQSLLCGGAIASFLFGKQYLGQTGLAGLGFNFGQNSHAGVGEIMQSLAVVAGCTLVAAINGLSLIRDGKWMDTLRGFFSVYALWPLIGWAVLILSSGDGMLNAFSIWFYLSQAAIIVVFLISLRIIKRNSAARSKA